MRPIAVPFVMVFAAVMLLFALSAPARAQGPVSLTPADPQPEAGALKPGLAVRYGYGEVKWLAQAAGWAGNTKPGAPLEGFVYGDSVVGERILTADSSEFVVAFIQGFMRFEAGIHELEFQSNDGLRVTLGGVKVYEHDGRHKCQTNGVVRITIPKSGWYPVKALFFNRKFTACLDLSIRPEGGEWDFTNPEMYAHLPQ